MLYYHIEHHAAGTYTVYPTVIHLWRNPIQWWRQFRRFGAPNITTTDAVTYQEYLKRKQELKEIWSG